MGHSTSFLDFRQGVLKNPHTFTLYVFVGTPEHHTHILGQLIGSLTGLSSQQAVRKSNVGIENWKLLPQQLLGKGYLVNLNIL